MRISECGPAYSCANQAACLDLYFSDSCVTAAEAGSGMAYTYCKMCLFWGNTRNCPKKPTDAISHVCAGDEFLPVVGNWSTSPVVGATAKLNTWKSGSNNRYCQWARWNTTSDYTDVYFTVKDGSGNCLTGSALVLNVTIAGVSATCQRPRTVNGIRFDCLHSDPSNYTAVVPDSSSGPAETCADQASCLDVYFSDACTTMADSDTGVVYTYCDVCLFWSSTRGCPKRDTGGETMSHVCSGDEFLPIVADWGLAPVTGATAKRDSWRGGEDDRYCQTVRWNASSDLADVYFSVKDGSGSCLPATKPRTSQPGSALTFTPQPSTAPTFTTQPLASIAEATKPHTAQPGTARTFTTKPLAPIAEATQPHTAQPGTALTFTPQPGTTVAFTPQPGTARTFTAQPGTALTFTTQPLAPIAEATQPHSA
ncbi:hypothetical protein GPECTOR_109g213 [Gonium pectorale]|uniref:Uncharacterized protein n=1 Tax=Gonium pectorale TaxID=33097 RepID=A0A150G0X8_GONPE|nr:hypothetical protein GPECTOR_109g213 [Gonium pectorale]|eukprot:KXZ42970.1 hypothetical protein GPECTOR_109g213 [Gonium pectorale]